MSTQDEDRPAAPTSPTGVPRTTRSGKQTGKRVAYRNLWISVPALLCGFAVWGMWGIITVQMLNLGLSVHPGRAVHADRDRRHLRRDDAHPGLVPDPPRGRAQHHLPHHRDAAGPGPGHRHRAAAQGLAAVGLPADGAVVRRGRRQLRQFHVQHQHLLPEAAAGHGAGPERGPRQLRRDHHAGRDPAGDDGGDLRQLRRRADDAAEGQRLDLRQDPRRHARPGSRTPASPGCCRWCRCRSCAGSA